MKKFEIWKKEISRRNFLKASGVAAASSMLLSGCNQTHRLFDDGTDRLNESTGLDLHNYDYTYVKEEVSRINTTCYMCAINCAAVGVLNEDGIVKRLEPNPKDPVSGGALCAKGNAGVAQLYDEDRLKSPMRKTGENTWEKITWDEAFDIMHQEFTRIAKEHGPETVVAFNRRGYYTNYLRAWLRAYGSPNGPLGQASICDGGKRIAQQLSVGASGLYCDFKNSKYIMLLGANQFEAPRYRLGMIDDILTAQENGAKVIVIDPRFNYTAAKADEYHRINSGTDGLLVLSMAHVIAKEGWEDQSFIEAHSVGFQEFKEEVLKEEYEPENTAEEIGISAEDIRRFAEEFAKAEGAIADTSSGAIMFQNGTQAHWAIMNLCAMTGNMLSKGGVLRRAGAKTSGPKFEENNVNGVKNFWTTAGYVEYKGNTEDGNRNIFADCVLEPTRVPAGPTLEADTVSLYDGKGLKALIVYQTDPIGSQLNTSRLKEAFAAMEFGVVIDIYLNQTAEALPIGGLALPECTYLERYAVRTGNGYTPTLLLNQPVIDPLWESKSAYWIFTKLGQRFGFEEFNRHDPEDEMGEMRSYIHDVDQGDGVTADWDALVEDGVWMLKDPEARNYNNYDKVFHGGKYYFAFVGDDLNSDHEMYLSAKGDIVPKFMKPYATTAEYPLRFMAGGKVLWHTQTSTRNNRYLMQSFDQNVIVKDKNYIVMSPEDAEERGIENGSMARIESPISGFEAEVLITKRMPAGFVHMTHGFGHTAPTMTLANGVGENSGSLCSESRLDPYSNCFTAKEEICNVTRS